MISTYCSGSLVAWRRPSARGSNRLRRSSDGSSCRLHHHRSRRLMVRNLGVGHIAEVDYKRCTSRYRYDIPCSFCTSHRGTLHSDRNVVCCRDIFGICRISGKHGRCNARFRKSLQTVLCIWSSIRTTKPCGHYERGPLTTRGVSRPTSPGNGR